MQSTDELSGVFQRSWQLLSSNWIIAVPGIIIGIVAGIVTTLLVSAATPAIMYDANGLPMGISHAPSFLALALAPIVSIIATILSITYTTGMAGAAWARGTATLADGSEAFRKDAGNVFVAMLIMIVVGIVAAILTPFTLGLSILAFLLFFLYTMPAAVVGGRPGMEAVSESFAIVMRKFGTTIIVVLLIFVISLVAGLISAALHAVPWIGPILGAVLQQIVIAYATLVIVGEYLKLRNPAVAPVVSSPPPPPSTPTF